MKRPLSSKASRYCAREASRMPTPKTDNECRPHRTTGRSAAHVKTRGCRFRKATVSEARAKKWRRRAGLRSVLLVGGDPTLTLSGANGRQLAYDFNRFPLSSYPASIHHLRSGGRLQVFDNMRSQNSFALHNPGVGSAPYVTQATGQPIITIGYPAVTCAIPGTAHVKCVADNLGAARGRLPNAEMRARMERLIDSVQESLSPDPLSLIPECRVCQDCRP